MNNIHNFLTVFTLTMMLTPSHAGTATGNVTGIFMHSPDVVMFGAGTITNVAACASATQQWAIKLSDPAGKGFLAILLSAQAQGKSVTVHGYTNTCRDWADRELPSYIVIRD